MGLVIEKSFLKLGRIKFANHNDVNAIERLVDDKCHHAFPHLDLHMLIELSVLSLCQFNTTGDVVGFISLNGYPNVPCLHSSAWEEYIWKHFKLTDMRSQNTLFVHMFCWDPQYSRIIVKNMLKSVYLYNAYINYIAIVMPSGGSKTIQAGYNMETMFNKTMEFKRGVKSTDLQFLYLAERNKINPRLRIRKAVEEDNDDLVPIIDRQSTRLKKLFGDFFISELIARHPESDRVLLVAEVAEVAVGVMCLNTVINYDLLNETFHLETFWGLHKQTEAEAQYQKETMKLKDANLQAENKPESSLDLNEESILYKEQLNVENIGANYEKNCYEELWKTILEKDGAFEFHIVNIDKNLLEVPNFLSYKKFVANCEEHYGSKENLGLPLKVQSASEGEEISELPNAKNIPKFSGQGNAFVIELFAMHHTIDERYGFDILEVAFEIFPDLDYCILALPTSHTVYPLLEHFTLVSPRVCRCECVSQALYVAHRNSVCGKINVRWGELADIKKATRLLSQLSITPQDLAAVLTSDSKQTFVMETECEPVGIAVVGPTERPLVNRSCYCLYNLRMIRYMEGEGIQVGQGTVEIIVISPIVQPHANFFLQEIFRLSGLSGLYWLRKAKGNKEAGFSCTSAGAAALCLKYYIIIRGRSNYEFVRDPIYMWYTNPHLTSLPKVDINHNIVVVGASCTAFAFLETLIFGGLYQYDKSCFPGAALFAASKHIENLPIELMVDTVTELMVEINRAEKYIVLSNGSHKYYDQLFLMCGIQYQHPDYLKELLCAEPGSNEESSRNCLHTLMDDSKRKEISFATKFFMPENFFIINTVFDADMALKYLHKHIKNKSDYNVVVYGATIQAYCCLNGLLREGIPPARIIFVESFPGGGKENYQVSFFNNEYVDEVVNKNIEELGIRVYRKYYVARNEKEWYTYSDNRLKTVKFISHEKLVEFECIAFFYYGLKGVNINTFIALNKCGIVYDGGVVIDDNFKTNDSDIYCAGTMTKYRRMCYLDNHKQMYYNYHDVGYTLGEIVRKQLDPFMNPGNTNTKKMNAPQMSLISINPDEKIFKLPKFQSPIILEAFLPGGLRYLDLREPGQKIPLEVYIPQERYGRVYETNKNGYFHLLFDTKNKVCGITCLSNKPFNRNNLSTLYGRHEQLLNNFMARFAANKIDDLFEYFNQTWMYALYHMNFNEFICEINVLSPMMEGLAKNIILQIENTLAFTNTPGSATAESRKACTSKYKNLDYGEQITAALVRWLSDRCETLPCYAVPEVVSYVCAQVNVMVALKK